MPALRSPDPRMHNVSSRGGGCPRTFFPVGGALCPDRKAKRHHSGPGSGRKAPPTSPSHSRALRGRGFIPRSEGQEAPFRHRIEAFLRQAQDKECPSHKPFRQTLPGTDFPVGGGSSPDCLSDPPRNPTKNISLFEKLDRQPFGMGSSALGGPAKESRFPVIAKPVGPGFLIAQTASPVARVGRNKVEASQNRFSVTPKCLAARTGAVRGLRIIAHDQRKIGQRQFSFKSIFRAETSKGNGWVENGFHRSSIRVGSGRKAPPTSPSHSRALRGRGFIPRSKGQ